MATTNVEPPSVPHHPDGKTCAACAHFKRCAWLLSYSGTETQCDWTPSRFREATKELAPPTE